MADGSPDPGAAAGRASRDAIRALDALHALPLGVWLCAGQRAPGGAVDDLRIEQANAAGAEALGAAAGAADGLPLRLVAPELSDADRATLLAVGATGEPARLSCTLAGGPAALDASRLSCGDVLVVVEPQNSAGRMAERYRMLLEATPDWVSFADGDGRHLYLNPGGRRLIGLEDGDAVAGLPLGSFSPDWVRVVAERDILPTARRDGVWRGDVARKHRDGHEIPVSQVTVATRGADGEVDFYATLARDISGEQSAARALADSEERFRVTFEQAPIGIALLSLEGTFLQVNDAYCATVRRSRADLLGRTTNDITHPDDLGITRDALREMVDGDHTSFRFEKRYIAPDGEPIWVEISGSPFRDATGRARFIIGQVNDIGDRRVAHVLQRSMLTTQLPEPDDVALAVRYLPASTDAEVSGDWYDVVELPGGRLGIAVGDVVGRGVEAAGTMGQLRTALRAYAVEGRGPAEAILRLHRLVDRLGEGLSTTVVLLELDPGTGDLSYVSAGHLPPVLRRADGTALLLRDGRTTPLGTAPLGAIAEPGEATLHPGDVVLLYTDGLIERRDDSLDHRLEQLSAALRTAPDDLDGLLDHVVQALLGGEPRHDDVALLALRTQTPAQAPLAQYVADGAALAAARRALRAWLREAGADADDVSDVLLAAGEACANGIEHAGGAVTIEARRSDGDVVISVRDEGAWRPPASRTERGHGLRLMRLVCDRVRVLPTDQGTHVELRRRLRRDAAAADRQTPTEASASYGPGAVTATRAAGVPVARLEGEVDLGCVARLRDAVRACLAPGDRGLVIDLSAVAYLDSAGLHLVYDVARDLHHQGQQVRVVAPADPRVARVTELVGLAETVPVDATVEAACSALAPTLPD